jgi:hypothetical protein
VNRAHHACALKKKHTSPFQDSAMIGWTIVRAHTQTRTESSPIAPNMPSASVLASLAVGLVVMALAGTPYTLSAFAQVLKARFGYTQTEIILVQTA